jgi:hypothetical protein
MCVFVNKTTKFVYSVSDSVVLVHPTLHYPLFLSFFVSVFTSDLESNRFLAYDCSLLCFSLSLYFIVSPLNSCHYCYFSWYKRK